MRHMVINGIPHLALLLVESVTMRHIDHHPISYAAQCIAPYASRAFAHPATVHFASQLRR
jgi:hypothetical protein